jgi:hypothetical protein
MKMTIVERQPPPHFQAATPARHPRKGPSIIKLLLCNFAAMTDVPVSYISPPALSNFQLAESDSNVFVRDGNSDATGGGIGVCCLVAVIINLGSLPVGKGTVCACKFALKKIRVQGGDYEKRSIE